MKNVTLVTGNENKLREAQEILGIKIVRQKIDLLEIQAGTSEEVSKFKAREAAKIVGGPVLVDDVALHFRALGGMPGVYIRDFVDRLCPADLVKLLEGFEDKHATCTCSIAYCRGPDEEPIVFTGKAEGTIVPPKGTGGFGFDPIFLPDGCSKTYAELTEDEKNGVSHRSRAWKLVADSGILKD